MKEYLCEVCSYIYREEDGDPDNDIASGTSFQDVPDDWLCPLCMEGKEVFTEI